MPNRPVLWVLLLTFSLAVQGRELLDIIPDTQADISIILNAHNLHRAVHSAPPMTWDSTMAASAASYAAQCVWQHSAPADRDYAGENIAAFAVRDCALQGRPPLISGHCLTGLSHSLTPLSCHTVSTDWISTLT